MPIRHAQQRSSSEQQSDIIAFLRQSSTYPDYPEVEVHETHGAMIFLAGDYAYKIKRAVDFGYMDYSTLEKRRRMVEAELRLNRVHAPNLYLGAVPITREADGHLALNGSGSPIEWAVRMRRFSQADLLGSRVKSGAVTSELLHQVADAIVLAHQRSEVFSSRDAYASLATTLTSLTTHLSDLSGAFPKTAVDAFATRARDNLQRHRALITQRAATGYVRRCHGDLHLDNIVVLEGKPAPFDAIEFNDDIAIVDTLYDLAFLLMDLDHAGHRQSANRVLNRYLWRAADLQNVSALALLPLFLGLRSAIRAMVTAQRAQLLTDEDAEFAQLKIAANTYLSDAIGYLSPPSPVLIAVGGLSGTGKSTLAASLAPRFAPAPGALHLRSDLERKALFGVAEAEHLPPDAYTPAIAARVYELIMTRARAAIDAGHSVVVDAVFAKASERAELSALATECSVSFHGLWLAAPVEKLIARVETRTGDASDADADVVRSQLARDVGDVSWLSVDASGTANETFENALFALASSQ